MQFIFHDETTYIDNSELEGVDIRPFFKFTDRIKGGQQGSLYFVSSSN